LARSFIRVRAYSSCANLGPGFDTLALAVDAFYDEVELELTDRRGVIDVVSVEGPYAREAGYCGTAVRALHAMIKDLDLHVGVKLRVYKGIPVAKGLGSSGATAAAAVLGLARALDLDIEPSKLVLYAGIGEEEAAGVAHFDNVAASLMGGLAIVSRLDGELRVAKIDLDCWVALLIPTTTLSVKKKTEFMRSIIPKIVPLESSVRNLGRVAMMVYAAMRGDVQGFAQMMRDDIVEPIRARYVPCYDEVRQAALNAGALGFALSGAGPTMLAITESEDQAQAVAAAMVRAYSRCGTARAVIARPAPPAHEV